MLDAVALFDQHRSIEQGKLNVRLGSDSPASVLLASSTSFGRGFSRTTAELPLIAPSAFNSFGTRGNQRQFCGPSGLCVGDLSWVHASGPPKSSSPQRRTGAHGGTSGRCPGAQQMPCVRHLTHEDCRFASVRPCGSGCSQGSAWLLTLEDARHYDRLCFPVTTAP